MGLQRWRDDEKCSEWYENWQHFNFASGGLSLISQLMCVWNTQSNICEYISTVLSGGLCIFKPHTASSYHNSLRIVSIQH